MLRVESPILCSELRFALKELSTGGEDSDGTEIQNGYSNRHLSPHMSGGNSQDVRGWVSSEASLLGILVDAHLPGASSGASSVPVS